MKKIYLFGYPCTPSKSITFGVQSIIRETQARQTSPEIQNRGISGLTKRTYVLQKILKKYFVIVLSLFTVLLIATINLQDLVKCLRTVL